MTSRPLVGWAVRWREELRSGMPSSASNKRSKSQAGRLAGNESRHFGGTSMKKSGCLLKAVFGLAVWAFVTGSVCAQNTGTQGAPAHLLVTVEARHGSSVPEISQRDVMVYEGHDRDQVTDWVPAQGDHAALELFILLDDGSGINLGTQLDGLRKFITAQPASTLVGVAYMQNGTAKVAQNPTSDHALPAKALRLPHGATRTTPR